jgi:hypothetical protein
MSRRPRFPHGTSHTSHLMGITIPVIPSHGKCKNGQFVSLRPGWVAFRGVVDLPWQLRKHSPGEPAGVAVLQLSGHAIGQHDGGLEVDEVGVGGRTPLAGGDAVRVVARGAGRLLVDDVEFVPGEGAVVEDARAVVALVAQGVGRWRSRGEIAGFLGGDQEALVARAVLPRPAPVRAVAIAALHGAGGGPAGLEAGNVGARPGRRRGGWRRRGAELQIACWLEMRRAMAASRRIAVAVALEANLVLGGDDADGRAGGVHAAIRPRRSKAGARVR